MGMWSFFPINSKRGHTEYVVCSCRCFASQSTIFHPSQQFFSHVGMFSCFHRLTSTKQRIKCLAQGHNTVRIVSLELPTLQSQISATVLEGFTIYMSLRLYRARTGLKSTWIWRACLKSPWRLNLPWKVLENHSKALKSPWILLFSVGLNTVDRDLNQY